MANENKSISSRIVQSIMEENSVLVSFQPSATGFWNLNMDMEREQTFP